MILHCKYKKLFRTCTNYILTHIIVYGLRPFFIILGKVINLIHLYYSGTCTCCSGKQFVQLASLTNHDNLIYVNIIPCRQSFKRISGLVQETDITLISVNSMGKPVGKYIVYDWITRARHSYNSSSHRPEAFVQIPCIILGWTISKWGLRVHLYDSNYLMHLFVHIK